MKAITTTTVTAVATAALLATVGMPSLNQPAASGVNTPDTAQEQTAASARETAPLLQTETSRHATSNPTFGVISQLVQDAQDQPALEQNSELSIVATAWLDGIEELEIEYISDETGEDAAAEQEIVVDADKLSAGGGGGGGGGDILIGTDGHEIVGILVFDPDQNRAYGSTSGSNPGLGGGTPDIISPYLGGPIAISGRSGSRAPSQTQALLAVPDVPEPASAALAIMGSLAIVSRRRRRA